MDPNAGNNEKMVIGGSLCSWEMKEPWELPKTRFRIPPYAERIWNYTMKRPFKDFDKRYQLCDQRLDELLSELHAPEPPVKVGASDEIYPDKIRVGWADGGQLPAGLRCIPEYGGRSGRLPAGWRGFT